MTSAGETKGVGIQKVAGVVLREGLLLVVRKQGTDSFISPGGKPDYGETPWQTLARELREETQTTLTHYDHFGTFSDVAAHDPQRMVQIEAWTSMVTGTARPSSEISEVAWIDAGYSRHGIKLGSVLERYIVPQLVNRQQIRRDFDDTADPPHTVVVDLDGTIAFRGHLHSGCEVELLRLRADPTTRLVLATSRAPRGVRQLVGALADACDLICCNGALIIEDGVEVARTTIPRDAVSTVSETCASFGADYYLDFGDRFSVTNLGSFPRLADYTDRVEWKAMMEGDELVIPEGVVKICVRLDFAKADEFVGELEDELRSSAQVDRHADGTVDVVAPGVTKRSAMRHWMSDLTNVVAYGNDANDFDLLAACGRAVLVGPDLPGLSRAGHVQCVPSDGDAVAATLRGIPSPSSG